MLQWRLEWVGDRSSVSKQSGMFSALHLIPNTVEGREGKEISWTAGRDAVVLL